MPSSGVHRGLQQPVGPDPGSWRRLGAAQGRGGDAGCRGALPGLQPAQPSPRQPASHGKSGQCCPATHGPGHRAGNTEKPQRRNFPRVEDIVMKPTERQFNFDLINYFCAGKYSFYL